MCLQVKVKDNNSNEPWALALRHVKDVRVIPNVIGYWV